MVLGRFEYEIANYFKRYIKHGSCCYDIGACAGYYSLAFTKLNTDGKVYAFEPYPDHYKIIKETIDYNELGKRIELFDYFLSNRTDTDSKTFSIDFLVFESNPKLQKPDFFKIDVDGPEYDILLGAEKTIKEYSPKMIIEVHSKELEDNCINLLMKNDYKIKIVKQRKFFKEYRPLDHNQWICATK
jgi:precorrin-6B methylase 2